MGQLVAKFRQWCEKLKTPEKFKNGELTKLTMDQDNVSISDKTGDDDENELHEEGADVKHEEEPEEQKEEEEKPKEKQQEEKREQMKDEIEEARKPEDVDTLITSQNQLLDQHKVRLEKLEHNMETLSQKMEQKDKELTAAENRGKILKEDGNYHWELLQEHSRILEQHEQKLNSQSAEIHTLHQMLDDKQGARQQSQGREEKQRSHTEQYEQLKKEVTSQLEYQQRLLDNLFAGFIVAFIIIVVISMLPRSDFSVTKQKIMDIFWSALSGLGLSDK